MTVSYDKIWPVVGYDYDESAKYHYSDLAQPEGEYITCIGSQCDDRSSFYEKGWKIRHLGYSDASIRLTGKYARSEPRFLQWVVSGDMHLFQAKINDYTIWLHEYELRRYEMKEKHKTDYDYIYSKSKWKGGDGEYLGSLDEYVCPGESAEKHFWSHIDALEW